MEAQGSELDGTRRGRSAALYPARWADPTHAGFDRSTEAYLGATAGVLGPTVHYTLGGPESDEHIVPSQTMARVTVRNIPKSHLYVCSLRQAKAWIRDLPDDIRVYFGESPPGYLGGYASDLFFFHAPAPDLLVVASLWDSIGSPAERRVRFHSVHRDVLDEQASARFAHWFDARLKKWFNQAGGSQRRPSVLMSVIVLRAGEFQMVDLSSNGRKV